MITIVLYTALSLHGFQNMVHRCSHLVKICIGWKQTRARTPPLTRWLINQKVNLKCRWEFDKCQDWKKRIPTNQRFGIWKEGTGTHSCQQEIRYRLWRWLILIGGWSSSSLCAQNKPNKSNLNLTNLICRVNDRTLPSEDCLCRNCFHSCSSKEIYEWHIVSCFNNEPALIQMPKPEENKMNVTNFQARWFAPLVIYFDL